MPHPEKRDLESTRSGLERWLAGKVRAAGVEVELFGGPSSTGFSSDTLLFDAEWANHSGLHREHLVIRFKPKGFLIFPAYDIACQYRVMKILGSTEVPVPRVRWLEEDEGPLGAPFYIMDRLGGRVPTDVPPYHTGGWIAELSPEQRQHLWWSGLEAMARIHRLDWRALDFDFLAEPQRGPTPLLQQLHYYDEFFRWGMDRRRHLLIEKVRSWLYENRPADEPVALCWGDSRPANQIFDERLDCAAVLDWEMVRLGDPVQDLAWWITADRCFSEGIGVDRLAGFPDRAATVARWEELVGREARHLRYYEVLALYRFAIIMSRVGQQMKHYEIFPPDSDMDVNNLATVTLERVLEEATT